MKNKSHILLGIILTSVATMSIAGIDTKLIPCVYLPTDPTGGMHVEISHQGVQCMWSPEDGRVPWLASFDVLSKGLTCYPGDEWENDENSGICGSEKSISSISMKISDRGGQIYATNGALRWRDNVTDGIVSWYDTVPANLFICGDAGLCKGSELPTTMGSNVYIIYTPQGG